MKTLFLKTFCGLSLFVLLSCDDETEKAISPTVVQFQNLNQTITEDSDEGAVVTLLLSKVATADGVITVTMTENMYQRIQTNPAHTQGKITFAGNKRIK